jgi:hypothetical protein
MTILSNAPLPKKVIARSYNDEAIPNDEIATPFGLAMAI